MAWTSTDSRASEKKYRLKRKALGICQACKSPARPGKTLCSDCNRKASARGIHYSRLRLARGLCAGCSNPAINGCKRCENCSIKQIARVNLGYAVKTGAWRLLKEKLAAQNFTCAYSGERLVVGANASLDHILPRSRGGDNSLDNLQWVTLSVNYMKRDLTHEEFLALVSTIHYRFNEVNQ